MSSLNILIRSLVKTYYQANLGFFFIVLYVAFGLMRSIEHITLAKSIATSLPLTSLTLLGWSIYYLKGVGFIYKNLNKKAFRFLREFAIHQKSKQFYGLFIVHLCMGIPVWLYAAFISIFNFQLGTISNFALMLIFLVSINSFTTLMVIYHLKRPVKEIQPGYWYKFISTKINLSYPFWYIRHLFVHEPMLGLLSKLGSLLILLGTFYLFNTDGYDWRLLAVGVLFSFIINSMLIYNYYEFNKKNYWIYNLPLKTSIVALSTLLTITLLFIPELVLICTRLPISITSQDSIGILVLSVSLAYFLLGALSLKPISKDKYGIRVFYGMVIILFIIMYSVPPILLNIVLLGSGILMLKGHYRLIN
jgi:hypothetical protein